MKYDQVIKKIFKGFNLDLTMRCNDIETNLKNILPIHKYKILSYLSNNTNIDEDTFILLNDQIECLIKCYLKNVLSLNDFFRYIYIEMLSRGNDLTQDKFHRCSSIVEFLIELIKPENIVEIHDKVDFTACYQKVSNLVSIVDGINIEEFNNDIIANCNKDLERITDFYNFYPEMLFDIRGDVISTIVTADILEVDTTKEEDINKLLQYIDRITTLNYIHNNPFHTEDHIVAIDILSKAQILLLQAKSQGTISEQIYIMYEEKILNFNNEPFTPEEEQQVQNYKLISNNVPSLK